MFCRSRRTDLCPPSSPFFVRPFFAGLFSARPGPDPDPQQTLTMGFRPARRRSQGRDPGPSGAGEQRCGAAPGLSPEWQEPCRTFPVPFIDTTGGRKGPKFFCGPLSFRAARPLLRTKFYLFPGNDLSSRSLSAGAELLSSFPDRPFRPEFWAFRKAQCRVERPTKASSSRRWRATRSANLPPFSMSSS